MSKKNFTVSVIVPCYNEKNNISEVVHRLLDTDIGEAAREIIIVDDGSSDGTRDILMKEIKPLVSKIVFHEKNSGKGAAIRTGIQHASGDAVIIQDADFEYNPSDIYKVVGPIMKGEADVVYGSRFLNAPAKGYIMNRVANKFLTALSNIFTGLKLTDMETCYKAFRREIISSITIQENRFGFEPEITAKVARLKYISAGEKHKFLIEVPSSKNSPQCKSWGIFYPSGHKADGSDIYFPSKFMYDVSGNHIPVLCHSPRSSTGGKRI